MMMNIEGISFNFETWIWTVDKLVAMNIKEIQEIIDLPEEEQKKICLLCADDPVAFKLKYGFIIKFKVK